jgi:hypothetical protein
VVATWAELAVLALMLARELVMWLRERSNTSGTAQLISEAWSDNPRAVESGGRDGVKPSVDDQTLTAVGTASIGPKRKHHPR